MNNARNKKISSIIVVSIIIVVLAFLISILAVNISKRARDMRRVKDISQIVLALELYSSSHGFYPKYLSELVKENMIPKIPNDPSGGPYHYVGLNPNNSGCGGFKIGASLETKNKVLSSDNDNQKYHSLCSGGNKEILNFLTKDDSPCKMDDSGKFCYDIQKF